MRGLGHMAVPVRWLAVAEQANRPAERSQAMLQRRSHLCEVEALARQARAPLRDCRHHKKRRKQMHIDRRQLALQALAVGLVGVSPALAGSPDEEAVAKSVEAFRAAQVAADAKAFDALCAAELSYSRSDARVEDKATFIANATSGKSKFLSLAYDDVKIRVVSNAAI